MSVNMPTGNSLAIRTCSESSGNPSSIRRCGESTVTAQQALLESKYQCKQKAVGKELATRRMRIANGEAVALVVRVRFDREGDALARGDVWEDASEWLPDPSWDLSKVSAFLGHPQPKALTWSTSNTWVVSRWRPLIYTNKNRGRASPCSNAVPQHALGGQTSAVHFPEQAVEVRKLIKTCS